jgi:hypothetical protein
MRLAALYLGQTHHIITYHTSGINEYNQWYSHRSCTHAQHTHTYIYGITVSINTLYHTSYSYSDDAQVCVARHHRGALAAELQRDGREMARRGLVHESAHKAVAGVADVVEALAQQRSRLRHRAAHAAHQARVQVLGDEALEQPLHFRRHLAGLHHAAVAGGDDLAERIEAGRAGMVGWAEG